MILTEKKLAIIIKLQDQYSRNYMQDALESLKEELSL